MNLMNRLLHYVAPAAHTTKSSMAAVAYNDIEHSVRTGDLLFFSDGTLLALLDGETRARYHCAMLATRALSRLPCLSATAVYWSSGADDAHLISEEEAADEGDQLFTPRAANCTVLPTEWLNWQHAALIVCLDGEQSGSTRPFVFISNGEGQFTLRPMRQVVAAATMMARSFFAVRHLIINQEEQLESAYGADASLRRFVSQRRGHLRDKIVAFHRSLLQQARQSPDPYYRHHEIMRIMAGPAPVEMRAGGGENTRDILLLMRASISFTTLCTLYAAQVLRIEPRAIDAAQLLQQHQVLQQHLAADYQFSDECLFVVEKQQQ